MSTIYKIIKKYLSQLWLKSETFWRILLRDLYYWTWNL